MKTKYTRLNRTGFYSGMIMVLTLMVNTIPSLAIEKESIAYLQDQQRVLPAPVELHITNSENAMINSTVSLNHEDAWLFFDNIRPSDVSANYLQYVLVNGNAFIDGSNGRMAIYAHGTVLMPHPAEYNPLTVFTGDEFTGDSMKLDISTYHDDLGTFNNAIRSFKLKRGYMATFASSADGSGYSRVFIADEEDILFRSMPVELYGTVSFIRIFKHNWVTKKGWAGGQWEAGLTNCTWNYDWSANGSTTNNIEYAVIKQNSGWPGWSQINNKTGVSQLLGFNEPDRPDQSDMTMEQALAAWPEFMKSGLRIGSPVTSDAFNSWSLFEFIDRCDELNYRVDFVAVHAYWVKSPQQWYNDLKYIHERTGRPIWITEWNNGANWTSEWWPSDWTAQQEKQLNDITAILQVLDTAHFVERYSIYNWVEDKRAMVLDGSLTPAGEYYASNKSRIAFNRINEVIPPKWVYNAPQLNYRYLTLSNKISLNWDENNSGLSAGYRLEKKVSNSDYVTIFETDDGSILNFTDDLDSSNSGRIIYRVSLKTVYGDFIPSNEVSYYQSQGNGSIQIGSLPVDNTDWNVCLFSEELSEKPLVISGIPTFNNLLAFTHRINAITKTSFKFQLDTWNYLNNPTLTKSDAIAIAALPAGIHDFGGLQGLAGEVLQVSGDWIPVVFDQPFDSLPVIFCTQVSNNTFFPTMPAIRDVTKTGFELCLRCEEDIPASSILDETVNYLAVEPGKGFIGNYRITIGQTGDGEEGISSSPAVLKYDTSYSKPLLFASMLTSADAFASTLRYYTSGDHEFTILKQRELSGTITAMKEDKLGWMVMDIAVNQPVYIINTTLKEKLPFYPNPVADKVYFSFRYPTHIVIYDLTGQKQVEKIVWHSLDLHPLSSGIYLLEAEGYLPVKIIKQ